MLQEVLKKTFNAGTMQAACPGSYRPLPGMDWWATDVFMLACFTSCYSPTKKDDAVLMARICDFELTRVRYGFWRIYVLLRREGWAVNHKHVYRLYELQGLNYRRKRPCGSRSAAHRLSRVQSGRFFQHWSLNFVADQFFEGRRFRALTVVHNWSPKCLTIHVGQSIKGSDVK